jgi:hypothetical protein
MKAQLHLVNGEVAITLGKPEGLEVDLWEEFMSKVDGRGSLVEVHIGNNSLILRSK